ncbi:MAG: hypothetical protein ACI38Q_04950 [Candidatus Bruticola sp.]
MVNADGTSVDVTPFAAFGNVYSDVLTSSNSEIHGQYQAVGYNGKHEGVADKISATASTPSGKQTVLIASPIYVTEQKVDSIKLAPANLDGLEITVSDNNTPNNPNDDYSTLVCVPEVFNGKTVHQSFNRKAGTFSLHGLNAEVDAINEQPMLALASFTSESGKGPSPTGVDVTDQTTFSAQNTTTYAIWITFDVETEGNIIRPKAIESKLASNVGYSNDIQVTGVYSNDGTELTASTKVRAKLGWSHTSFAFKQDDGTYRPVSYELNQYVYKTNSDPLNAGNDILCGVKTNPKLVVSQEFYLKGVICYGGKTFCCDIPEELLPADGYPGASSGGAGISTVTPSLRQTVSKHNNYLFEVTWYGSSSYDHAYLKIREDSVWTAACLPSFAPGEVYNINRSYGSYIASGIIDIGSN